MLSASRLNCCFTGKAGKVPSKSLHGSKKVATVKISVTSHPNRSDVFCGVVSHMTLQNHTSDGGRDALSGSSLPQVKLDYREGLFSTKQETRDEMRWLFHSSIKHATTSICVQKWHKISGVITQVTEKEMPALTPQFDLSPNKENVT